MHQTIRALWIEGIKKKFDPRREFLDPSLKKSQLVAIAEKAGLYFIGQGSGRAVYALSSKKVLKIAWSTNGEKQNKIETRSSRASKLSKITTRVLDYDPLMRWIVSELVKPLTSEADFADISGVDWDDFASELEVAVWREKRRPTDRSQDTFVRTVAQAVVESSLDVSDLVRMVNWGTTSDRRLVVLDVGLEEQMKELRAYLKMVLCEAIEKVKYAEIITSKTTMTMKKILL